MRGEGIEEILEIWKKKYLEQIPLEVTEAAAEHALSRLQEIHRAASTEIEAKGMQLNFSEKELQGYLSQNTRNCSHVGSIVIHSKHLEGSGGLEKALETTELRKRKLGDSSKEEESDKTSWVRAESGSYYNLDLIWKVEQLGADEVYIYYAGSTPDASRLLLTGDEATGFMLAFWQKVEE